MPELRQPQVVAAASPGFRASLVDGERLAVHRHPRGQLVYPATGLLAITTERGTWMAPANRVTWTPAGFDHSHQAFGSTDGRVVSLSRALGAGLPAGPAVFGVSPLLREVLLALTNGRRLQPAAHNRLLRVAVDELTGVPEQSLDLPEPRDDRLRALTDRLHADPANAATLTELGRSVGASERTLSRLFHTELAMSFHQWRTQLRIQHALVHLMNGHPVTEVAVLCGWSNPTSFIEAFTAALGQTPGRYQADLRQGER
jgi:AraC-like DNA-binding protein